MTAIAYSFPTHNAPGAPLVLVPEAPSQAAVYRRRRVVAAVIVLAITFLLGLALNAAVTAVAQSNSPVLVSQVSESGPMSYTVQSGDTLWSIASAAHPGEDPRPLVAQMKKAGVSASLQPGQVITIP